MSEEQAARYKDAEKVEGTLEIRKPLGSTSGWRTSLPLSAQNDPLKAPGNSSGSDSSKHLNDEQAALQLAAWARRQAIAVSFVVRKVNDNDVILVSLRSSKTTH